MSAELIVHYLQFGQTPCQMEMPPKDWPEGHKWHGDWANVTCPECLRGKDIAMTFSISEDEKSITCLRCKRTSHNPNDVAKRYCGHCHAFHDDIWPPARRWWVEHPDAVPASLEAEALAVVRALYGLRTQCTYKPEQFSAASDALEAARLVLKKADARRS